jgi:hypothetical protein
MPLEGSSSLGFIDVQVVVLKAQTLTLATSGMSWEQLRLYTPEMVSRVSTGDILQWLVTYCTNLER